MEFSLEFSLFDHLWALFLINRWKRCKSQVKPVKVGFFSCWKQSHGPWWLLQSARVCESSSGQHQVMDKTKDTRVMKLEFQQAPISSVVHSSLRHRKQLLGARLMNWAQGGVRDHLGHIHTVPGLRKPRGRLLLSKNCCGSVLSSLGQTEPDSDVNWSKVFLKSCLNLITPKKPAPPSHSLCQALLLSLEPRTVYYFPNFQSQHSLFEHSSLPMSLGCRIWDCL